MERAAEPSLVTRRRVVVWGLGPHAQRKLLPAVAALHSLELYGVCSRDAIKVDEASRGWSCRPYLDADAMLRDPAVDVVYVATPIGLHAEHGRRVLAAGKHLWCEKPLTTNLSATAALAATSREQNLAIAEGHMYLHHPHFAQVRRCVTDGSLGEIVSVACRFGIPPLDAPGFRADPALGGGALFDVGCYPVSALHALFEGPFRLLRAAITTRPGSRVDTDGEALIELPNQATARLEWRINTAYRNEIDLWGERGSLFTERIFSKPATFVPTLRLRNRQGVETVAESQAADHFVLMLQDFAQIIDDRKAAEAERQRIVERAAILDQIASQCGLHQS
jgi:dTDP-3,4-didehydro-2,6-dideoxy-alpha-D-glucose 3-reductase